MSVNDKDNDNNKEKDSYLLRKLGLHSSNPPSPESSNGKVIDLPEKTDDDEAVAGRCFGYLRGVRDRALTLEFRRLKEADSVAFAYGSLTSSRFYPPVGVLMVFEGTIIYGVRVRGRNLNLLQDEGFCLYDRGLLRNRVTFIREMSKEQCRQAGENECVVERIEIEALEPEQVSGFLGLAA